MNCDSMALQPDAEQLNVQSSSIQNPVMKWILNSIAQDAVQSYDRNGCYAWGCTNISHDAYHD